MLAGRKYPSGSLVVDFDTGRIGHTISFNGLWYLVPGLAVLGEGLDGESQRD